MACQRAAWAEFAREIAPRRPLLLGHFDYARCLDLAKRSLKGPLTTIVPLVPIWVCRTEDAVSTEWVAVHGAAWADRPLELQERAPFLHDAWPRADALWSCHVRRWTAATVVKRDEYGSSIPLKHRAGAFGVLELQIVEVLSVDVRETEPLPRPTREVPIFAWWYEPRTRVSPELERQIRALSFAAPGDREGLP